MLWCVAGSAAVCCLVAGAVLYAIAIATHHDVESPPVGEYVRLFVVMMTLWGPMAVLTMWKITVPAIVVLGVVVSLLRS